MFGDRLKELRDHMGISQRELAKLIQLSPSTVAMYELDQRSPDKDTIITLANLFNCTTDYLLGQINVKPASIPILGTIRAGLPILADENIEGYLDVPESMRADYVLRVTGDSMIGSGILEGDYAICRESQEANSGQIVVAIKDVHDGFAEATLKYYYNNGKGPVLRPANPNYSELLMSDGYRIKGVMVALVRQDAPGYQVYRDYLTISGQEEWTEVIELASEAGLKVNQVKEILAGQIEIAKKLRG